MKIELAPARKQSACISSVIAVRPADSRISDIGIKILASATARKGNRIDWLGLGERRSFNWDQHIDRHAFRMFRKIRERSQHFHTVERLLSHSEDTATANLHTRFMDVLERIQAIGESARRDNLCIVPLRRIDIMVVVFETCVGELARLLRVEHAQGHACFHPERPHTSDHFGNRRHITRLWRSPGCPHAESSRTGSQCRLCLLDHTRRIYQLGCLKPDVVMGGLAAVTTILRTSASLDIQEPAKLDFVGIEYGTVDRLRPEDHINERRLVDRQSFVARPVMADGKKLLPFGEIALLYFMTIARDRRRLLRFYPLCHPGLPFEKSQYGDSEGLIMIIYTTKSISGREQPAIDRQDCPADKARPVRSQKGHRIGYIRRSRQLA